MINNFAAFFNRFKAESGGTFDLSNATGGFFLRTAVKTADYTCVRGDSGTIFTTTGATGAVNFTLPPVYKGWFAFFAAGADQNLTITAATADTLRVLNDLAADSLAFSTSSEKIGALAMVFCDGAGYFAVNLSDNTDTPAS